MEGERGGLERGGVVEGGRGSEVVEVAYAWILWIS